MAVGDYNVACFEPITAYRLADGSVVLGQRNGNVAELKLPCGRCTGCLLERSRQWTLRIQHESQLYEQNCFITLTYDDAHLPFDNGLHYRDFQLFFKRLRRDNPKKTIRFYMAGEYGESLGRPHFHACIFNHSFGGLVPVSKSSTSIIYSSEELSRLWPMGFSSVGELNFQTAAYVARYVMKKRFGSGAARKFYRSVDSDTGEIFERSPEFNKMSLKPGIGAGWFDKFNTDVYPHDHVISNGVPTKPPRYYDKLFKKIDPQKLKIIQERRELRAFEHSADNTKDRLFAKKVVTEARLSQLKRTLK